MNKIERTTTKILEGESKASEAGAPFKVPTTTKLFEMKQTTPSALIKQVSDVESKQMVVVKIHYHNLKVSSRQLRDKI